MSEPVPPRSRGHGGAAAWLGYIVLATAMTWPVASTLATRVPFYNDTWIFVWNLHATRAALLDPGQDVFATDRVFHPEGISLAFHTLAPLYGALAVPLEPWLGLIRTYNLLFLATFVTAAASARMLALRLTGSPGGAFLAGFLFAFSPYHLAHSPHLNLLSIQFLPLTALALLALLETASLRAAAALAATAVLSFYACLEYALCSLLLAIVVTLYAALTRGRGGLTLAPPGRLLLAIAAASGLALVLALPGLLPIVAEASVERHYDDPVDWMFSADVFSWITPSVLHSLWGGYTMKIYQHFPGVLAEWTTFIGVATAALALVALGARRRAPIALWWTVALVFALLAMGPSLRVLGEPWPIPLPYRLLDALPVLKAMREPSRFAVLVTLAMAVLAAFGYRELRRSERPWLRRAARPALALAALEFVSVPLPTSTAAYPAFLDRMAADGEDYAVLDVPSDLAFREHLYHQAVHGKRIFAGYVARIPEASRRWLETLPLLDDPSRWSDDAHSLAWRARLARALDVRYALVHAEFYERRGRPADFRAALARLEALPGARVVAREEGFVAVRIDGR